jgi:hypothetical protein
MMRFGSNLHLTPAGIGLIMVTLLLVGAIVVRVMTVSEHSEIRAHTTSENGNRVTLDIGVADLEGVRCREITCWTATRVRRTMDARNFI